MKRNVRLVLLTLMLSGMLGAPALALGPVDGDVSALWWDNEWTSTEGASSNSYDAAAPGYRATVWLKNRYGVRAEMFSSEPDAAGFESSDSTSFDVMWRAFAPTERSFVAVGFGWQDMELGSIQADAETSGMRLTMDARLGLTDKLDAYGAAAYFPSLDDAGSQAGETTLEDLDGYQAELGLAWRVAPALSVVGGWRLDSLDFMRSTVLPLTAPLAGTPVGGGPTAGSAGSITLAPPMPQGDGCGCEAAVTSQGGSAESTGLFVGLNFRF